MKNRFKSFNFHFLLLFWLKIYTPYYVKFKSQKFSSQVKPYQNLKPSISSHLLFDSIRWLDLAHNTIHEVIDFDTGLTQKNCNINGLRHPAASFPWLSHKNRCYFEQITLFLELEVLYFLLRDSKTNSFQMALSSKI